MEMPRGQQSRALLFATLGTIAVVGFSALAVTQILWLNPLAAVPGKSLHQISLDMARANESLQAPMVFGTMVIGPLFAIALLVGCAVWKRVPPATVAVTYLGTLALGAGAYFMASFGAGMGLADTYGIGGADYSPWAWPLYAVSGAAVIALAGLGISRRKRPPIHGAAPNR